MRRRWAEWAIVATIAAGCLGLAWVAAHLAIDYWDGFDYLRNARLLAGHRSPHVSPDYSYARPPLVSLLIAPTLWGYAPAGAGTAVTGPHLICLGLGVLGLWATYRLCRLALDPTESAVATLLVFLNPLFIHYAPFVMMDVPSMAFTALALWAWLRAREGNPWRWFVAAGVLIGATVCTKYPAALLVPTLGLFEMTQAIRTRRVFDPRPWVAVAVAAATVYGIHALSYRLAAFGGGETLRWMRAALDWGFGHNTNGFETDPTWEYGAELWHLLTPPLFILGMLGAVEALRRRTASDVLHLLWVAVFLGMMTFRMGHKEARYVMPALPSLAFLEVRGFQLLTRLLRSRGAVVLAAALLAWPVCEAFAEGRRFADPVYRQPLLPRVAEYILSRSGPDAHYVLEGYFTAYPKDPVTMPLDEYFHFHTLNFSAFEYYLDDGVEQGSASKDPGPAMIARFPHGGAIITSPAGTFDSAHRPPPDPPAPLQVTSISRDTLRRTPRGSYASPGREVELVQAGGRWHLKPTGGLGGWKVFARSPTGLEEVGPEGTDSLPLYLELLRVESAEFLSR